MSCRNRNNSVTLLPMRRAQFVRGALCVLASLVAALCMTPALNNSALWTGWLLATATPEDGLVAEVAGALRLAALCAFLGLLTVWLVRKKDYLPEEGEPREL